MIDLERFVANDYDRVVRAVALASGDADAASEAVQEALARALEAERRGTEIRHLSAWVAVVALNVTRRRFRRRRQEMDLVAAIRVPIGVEPAPDPAVELHRALVHLPLRQRQAVVLHHLLDLDVTTTAQLLRVSDGTVKTALSRGRATLQRSLASLTDSVEGSRDE